MEKAYDLKELGVKVAAAAKKEGLDSEFVKQLEEKAEKVAKAVYDASKEWAKESAAISENKLDDLVAGYYDTLDGLVLPTIEKLDLDKDGQ